MYPITIKRIYDTPAPDDGYRILVDRLWPRGVSKEKAKLDEWNRNIAPSHALRKWFDHQEERFVEFVARYEKELETETNELQRIKALASVKKLTLLYGAKDESKNQAVVLKAILQKLSA